MDNTQPQNTYTMANATGAAPAAMPAMNVAPETSRGKNTLVLVLLTILALGGIGFGVASWLFNAERISSLEEQISQNDPDSGATDSAEPLAKKLLITGEVANVDAEPLYTTIWRGLNNTAGESVITATLERGTEALEENENIFGWSGTRLYLRFDNFIYGWDYYDNDNHPLSFSDEHIEISDIDATRVVDMLVTGFGQAIGDETVFFLMDDGTVEYLPVIKAIKENKFESYGKLPGLENVIGFPQIQITYGVVGGGVNAYTQTADGKVYSLYEIIRETGNYEN